MTTLPELADRPGAPVTIRLAADQIHLETGEGVALFYFAPLRRSSAADPVPWGGTWPVGVRNWILQWPPLIGDPQAGFGVDAGDFGQQLRPIEQDPDYPGYQVTYRGWPLYICHLTRNPDSAEVPGMWLRASVTLGAFSYAAESSSQAVEATARGVVRPEEGVDDPPLVGDPPRSYGGP